IKKFVHTGPPLYCGEGRLVQYAFASTDKNDSMRSMPRPKMPLRKTASELRLCPAVGFSQIVGGKYKLRILWVLNKRPHRYGEIRLSLLKGTLGRPVTPRVLSRELRQLQ